MSLDTAASEPQKVSGINWSPFLVHFLEILLLVITVPHVLFWIPYWVQLASGQDLGWQLFGLNFLPSLLLNVAYLACVIMLIYWVILKMSVFSRFPVKTTSDQVSFEDIEIPIGGGHSLAGVIVRGPNTPAKNAPVMICCHGMGGQKEDYFPIGIPMSFLGFAVLFYDCRGHGHTKFGSKWDTWYIIQDFSRVVDYVVARAEKQGDLDASQIIAWGASMGGGIVLNEAYLDHRVKFIIAVCTWADFQMTATRKLKTLMARVVKAGYEIMGINLMPTNRQNRLISPIYNSFNRKKGFFGHPIPWEINNDYRVMLAHDRDDDVVNFENFEQNRDFLKIKPVNYIVFDKGNHAFAGNETALVGKMMLWFWMRGY